MAIVFSAKINGDVTDMYTQNNYYTGTYARFCCYTFPPAH